MRTKSLLDILWISDKIFQNLIGSIELSHIIIGVCFEVNKPSQSGQFLLFSN